MLYVRSLSGVILTLIGCLLFFEDGCLLDLVIGVVVPLGLVILILGLGDCSGVFFVTDLFFDPLPAGLLRVLTTFFWVCLLFLFVVIHITSSLPQNDFVSMPCCCKAVQQNIFSSCVFVLVGVLAVLTNFDSAHSLHYSYYRYVHYNDIVYSYIVVALLLFVPFFFMQSCSNIN